MHSTSYQLIGFERKTEGKRAGTQVREGVQRWVGRELGIHVMT
jgi:hypothetical protein